MSTANILEVGWASTGFVLLWDKVNLLATVDPQSYLLIVGYVATGVGILGAKGIEIYQKWRLANKDTDKGRLDQCLTDKEMQELHSKEQLRLKDEEISTLKNVISSLQATIQDLLNNISNISKNVNGQVQKDLTPETKVTTIAVTGEQNS